jgi:hypothetical protein
MKFAKTIFAILASVMLVGTQTVSVVGQHSSQAPQECSCCSCKQMDCCVAQSDSTPQPVPVAPVRSVSQNQSQFVVAIVSVLSYSLETPAQKISFPPSASLKLTAVPLYEWNCSYLI